MLKNVAGQVVGVQMLLASNHTAFSGGVTVYVTGDGGTQTVGTANSGTATHEGNGYYTYEPDQAETNFNQVAFTFTGASAIPATEKFEPTADIEELLGNIIGSFPANFDNLKIAQNTGVLSKVELNAGAIVTASFGTGGKTGFSLAANGLAAVLVDGLTLPQALQVIAAAVAGKITTAGTATEVFKGLDGTTTRVTVTVDADGNRSAVVYNTT